MIPLPQDDQPERQGPLVRHQPVPTVHPGQAISDLAHWAALLGSMSGLEPAQPNPYRQFFAHESRQQMTDQPASPEVQGHVRRALMGALFS